MTTADSDFNIIGIKEIATPARSSHTPTISHRFSPPLQFLDLKTANNRLGDYYDSTESDIGSVNSDAIREHTSGASWLFSPSGIIGLIGLGSVHLH